MIIFPPICSCDELNLISIQQMQRKPYRHGRPLFATLDGRIRFNRRLHSSYIGRVIVMSNRSAAEASAEHHHTKYLHGARTMLYDEVTHAQDAFDFNDLLWTQYARRTGFTFHVTARLPLAPRILISSNDGTFPSQ